MFYSSDLVVRADAFAAIAHAMPRPAYPFGQFRKYVGLPYITHPRAVAALVAKVGLDHEVIAAALLHDTLEDTDVRVYDLRREFGDEVTALVIEVTDVSEPTDGNRAARKAKDLAHLALASSHGQSIKVADLIDNTHSIVRYDPGFARVYLREKRALLNVLTKADPILLEMAMASLEAGEDAVFADVA